MDLMLTKPKAFLSKISDKHIYDQLLQNYRLENMLLQELG